MARVKKKPPVKNWYVMRLRSSRGTDICHCLEVAGKHDARDVRVIMERHAEDITRGTACREYTVSWQKVRLPKRRALVKIYHQACERKDRAEAVWKKLAAMLHPRKV